MCLPRRAATPPPTAAEAARAAAASSSPASFSVRAVEVRHRHEFRFCLLCYPPAAAEVNQAAVRGAEGLLCFGRRRSETCLVEAGSVFHVVAMGVEV